MEDWQQMEDWLVGFYRKHHLTRDQDKAMFGQVERFLSHTHLAYVQAEA